MRDTLIRTGHWIDWNHGPILGRRITMSSSSAGVLIAFIALFDALIGNLFWNLLSFLIHQHRAKDNRPRDGLHHQLQALLRNSNEPLAFAQTVIHSGWRWSGRAYRALPRTLFLAFLAISISLLFALAGVASSQLASSGAVLLTGEKCGYFLVPAFSKIPSGVVGELEVLSQYTTWMRESMDYAENCYVNLLQNKSLTPATRVSPGASCHLYIKPTLDWTTTLGNPCPFADSSVCSVSEADIMKLDTGLLDSIDDLGIDMKEENRLFFRRVETCSPLVSTGFSNNSFTMTNTGGGNTSVAIYSYGPNHDAPYNLNISAEWQDSNNVTFMYPESIYKNFDNPYYLAAASRLSTPYNSERSFHPDARLTEDESLPVSLFFLANRAYYVGAAVQDPWFQASENGTILGYSGVPGYYSSLPGSVLGCVEQAQICTNNNSTQPTCTDLSSWWTSSSGVNTTQFEALGLNPTQTVIANNILSYLHTSSFESIVSQLGADSLLASKAIASPSSQPFSAPLPSNQWQIEVENWMAIANSHLQRSNLAHITGPTDSSLLQYWQAPTSSDATSLCRAQKIKSTAYQSFSVLGLAINFAIGCFIAVAAASVRYMAPSVELCRRKATGSQAGGADDAPTTPRHAWILDGVLQLQRMAYEELGLGDWEGDGTVPLAKAGEVFPRPTFVSQELFEGFSSTASSFSVAGNSDDEEFVLPKRLSATYFASTRNPEPIDIVLRD